MKFLFEAQHISSLVSNPMPSHQSSSNRALSFPMTSRGGADNEFAAVVVVLHFAGQRLQSTSRWDVE
jgi:hypothetical protein